MALLLCTAAESGPAAEPSRSPFYYHGGQQIGLQHAEYVAIRWRPEATPGVLSRFPVQLDTFQRELSTEGLKLYRLEPALPETQIPGLLEELARLPEIERVAPVFRAPEALMVVTDQLIARFAAGVDEETLTRLCDQFGLDLRDQASWTPSLYLMGSRDGDALGAANALHQQPEVLWAQPDFLRLVDRPYLSPPGHGPLGVHLGILESSADTPISKGSHHSLVSEPAIFNSRIDFQGRDPLRIEPPVDRIRLKSEGFEGPFPDAWQLVGDPTWNAVSYRPFSDLWSGYSVGSSVAPPGPYPNLVDSWMVFGPLSLVGAQAARVDLQAWIDTESYYDYFKIAVSIDGAQWYGLQFSGDWGGWRNIALDLEQVPALGSILEQPQVWFALVFQSDVSIGYEGVYVDDIAIEIIAGGYQDLTSDEFDHLQWGLENNEQLWGVADADIQALTAWDISQGSNDVTIAVIDEGVDLTHPDLAARLVPGYDATGGGSDGAATGDEAHGTACAAIAAAVTGNGVGVAGVAGEARLMPVRIFVGGYTSDSWAADGIAWAATNGADILSNSWGGGLPSSAIDDAIQYANTAGRDGKGAIPIFAAGNSNRDTVSYPASLVDTLAVGALSPCDQRKSHISCDGEFWWGSNYGESLDLMAPGVLMYSADLAGEDGYQPGDYLSNFNGTSSAAPVVAGVAALLLAVAPDLSGNDTRTLILDSAHDLLTPDWDPETGHGRVDAFSALSRLLTNSTDLEALDVYLRDAPAGGGSVVESPSVGQQVYAHFLFATTSQVPLTGRIASIDLDGELLCDTVDSFASGEHLVWCSTPWQATVGIHELRGWVDPDGLISEFEENNNMIEAVIVVRTDEVEIFSDGFETGDVSTWSESAP